MNAPEIRPYHNEPEKRWLVCGNYRVAFSVAGDTETVVTSLRRACEEMLRLTEAPKSKHKPVPVCGARKEGEAVSCSMPAGHDCIRVGRKPDGGRMAWW
jgi:acid phosphatase class B